MPRLVVALAVVHLTLAGLAKPSTAVTQPPPWGGFRGNAARSGSSAYPGPTAPSVLWHIDGLVDSSSEEPAVAADGTVYVRNYHELVAISSSGGIRWRRPVETGGGTPAIGPDGTIYAVSSKLADTPSRTNLLAFSPDGHRKWRLGFKRDTGFAQGPIVGNRGDIYVSDNHRVYAISPRGALRWTWEPDEPVEGLGLYGPAQGPDGTLYVSAAGVLCAVKPTGSEAWCRKATAGAAFPVVSPADGHIYVSFGRRMVAFDSGGRHLWGRSVYLASPPAVDSEGNVVVVSGSGAVISYTADGRVRWARFRGARTERPAGELTASLLARVEKQLLGHFADHRLKVPIVEAFPLAQVNEAYDRFAVGGKFGKIVVNP